MPARSVADPFACSWLLPFAGSVLPFEDTFPIEIGGQGAGLPDLVLRAGQEVPVDDELGRERPRVEVEPGRLDVDHDPQPCGLRDRVAAHEVRVGDAWPGRGDRSVLVDLLVGVEQGVHGAVAYAVRRELQARLNG